MQPPMLVQANEEAEAQLPTLDAVATVASAAPTADAGLPQHG
jgi:hypothetical protein